MSQLPDNFKFKFEWRKYQERFLNNFQLHIHDNHLHVVAPPGSGKTVLGLEMVGRINKKTLILAPTLTIRNQWKDRLFEFFLGDEGFKNYSFDIKNPSLITFSTYQSLHAFFKKEENISDFFHKAGIEVIVLDEAHHLKNEWWKCLFELKNIPDLNIIALTATPPYDSSSTELTKYFQLCGPIDDEISVPELIKEKNLCPHQDYVFFSLPQEKEIQQIIKYRDRIFNFINELEKDEEFIHLLVNHPFYRITNECLDSIYDNPSYFSAVLIFLNSSGFQFDKEKIKILGFDKNEIEIPKLSYEWIEILLQNLLVTDREWLTEFEDKLSEIEKKIRKIGVFEAKKINLTGNDNLYKSLTNSPSKLQSIGQIVEAEFDHLNDGLRCVILSDFIRKEFLDYIDETSSPLNKLGVTSIFQYLRTTIKNKENLGVLSGSLVILHESALKGLDVKLGRDQYHISPLEVDHEFYIISPTTHGKSKIVSAVTILFETGKIKVLVGTKSLLGEGWDAPTINTLILASFIGSFVLSNQMRGRAIRVQKDNPDKTGNIWHLACIDPTIATGGGDVEKLTRRFDAFCGISISEPTYIENGIDRLKLPYKYHEQVNVDLLNEQSLEIASKRNQMAKKWHTAIESGNVLLRELKVFYKGDESYPSQKKLHYLDAVKYIFVELGAAVAFFTIEFLIKNALVLLSKGVLYFVYALLTAFIIGFLPKTYKAIRLYVMFGRVDKIIKNMGEAVLNTLYDLNHIITLKENIKLEVEKFPNGEITCYLKGATEHESNSFITALQEILDPVENPRYLIVRAGWIQKALGISNYHSVPSIFGFRKKEAIIFFNNWKSSVGKSKMVFTRNLGGRKLLLKGRLHHIKHTLQETTKKSVSWK